ncbi:MAG: hypothetical protein CSA11_10025 [Chloroflexi bacterium]|nr:MAG: hypothetical protein CSA11_10025 [Chloroflexota bacterium]
MVKRILVVGVGGGGPEVLPQKVLARIEAADCLWGGKRLLQLWPDFVGEKRPLSKIPDMISSLAERGEKQVVVLASGDPGFYGIAGTLLRHFAPDELEIVPHVSSLQLAFARCGLVWQDAVLTSTHGRPLTELVGWAKRAAKIGVLTDHKRTPSVIAKTLLAAGVPDCRAIVAENVGLPDERIVETRLAALPAQEFARLNVLLLLQDADWRPAPLFAPRPESAYAHRRGLITKQDVRALSLARLALRETDVVWDVGAGSGAVSVEMAELAWRGQLFAIEHDAENLGYIRQNMARFGVLNVAVVAGRAPQMLHDLPAPDAVFIGGTGGAMREILQVVDGVKRPFFRVVVNVATLENLSLAVATMRELGWRVDVTQAAINQSKPIGGMMRLAPLNPIFIITGKEK